MGIWVIARRRGSSRSAPDASRTIISQVSKVYACEGCRARSKATDLGSVLRGVQGFESLPSHYRPPTSRNGRRLVPHVTVSSMILTRESDTPTITRGIDSSLVLRGLPSPASPPSICNGKLPAPPRRGSAGDTRAYPKALLTVGGYSGGQLLSAAPTFNMRMSLPARPICIANRPDLWFFRALGKQRQQHR